VSWCCSLPAVISVWALCQTEHHPDFDISYCPSVCHCSDHSIALLYAHCSPAGWKFAPCTASRTWSAIEEGNPSPSPKSPPITIKLTKDVQTMLNTGINLPNPVHAHHESQPHRSVPVMNATLFNSRPHQSYCAKDELQSSDELQYGPGEVYRPVGTWGLTCAQTHICRAERGRCPIRRRARRRRSGRRPRSASDGRGRGLIVDAPPRGFGWPIVFFAFFYLCCLSAA
jgi:hypothetical protein